MRIKFWPIVTLVIVVMLVLTIPFIHGVIFKRNYLNFITALQADQQVKINVVDYKLGWFSSDVKLNIGLIGTSLPVNRFSLTLDEHVCHGPIVYNSATQTWALAQAAIQGTFHFPHAIESLLLGNKANEGVMKMHTLATFGNQYIIQIKTPAFSLQLPFATMSWEGLKGKMNLYLNNENFERVASEVDLGAFSGEAHNASLVSEKIIFKEDASLHSLGLWEGTYQFNVPSIVAKVTDKGRIYSINNLNLSYLFSVVAPNFYNIQMQLSVGKLSVPEGSIDSSSFSMNAKKMSASGWANFIQVASRSKGNPDQIATQFPTLLLPETIITENASVNTSFGQFISSGQFSWPGEVKTMADVARLFTYEINVRISQSLINQIIKSNQVKAPVSPTSQVATLTSAAETKQPLQNQGITQATLDDWVSKGYLMIDKDDYVSVITRENGITKANGHEFDISSLKRQGQ